MTALPAVSAFKFSSAIVKKVSRDVVRMLLSLMSFEVFLAFPGHPDFCDVALEQYVLLNVFQRIGGFTAEIASVLLLADVYAAEETRGEL